MLQARAVLTLLAVLVLALTAAAPTRAGVPSSYSVTPLTPELRALLLQALGDERQYRACVARRICVTDITGVKQQQQQQQTAATGNGSKARDTNYAFTVSGCDVEATLKAQLKVATKSAVASELGACSDAMTANCVATIRSGVVTVCEREVVDGDNKLEVASIIVSG